MLIKARVCCCTCDEWLLGGVTWNATSQNVLLHRSTKNVTKIQKQIYEWALQLWRRSVPGCGPACTDTSCTLQMSAALDKNCCVEDSKEWEPWTMQLIVRKCNNLPLYRIPWSFFECLFWPKESSFPVTSHSSWLPEQVARHVSVIPRCSTTPVYAYCKQSKTGSVEGLWTRLRRVPCRCPSIC